jgi:hypothetical protein
MRTTCGTWIRWPQSWLCKLPSACASPRRQLRSLADIATIFFAHVLIDLHGQCARGVYGHPRPFVGQRSNVALCFQGHSGRNTGLPASRPWWIRDAAHFLVRLRAPRFGLRTASRQPVGRTGSISVPRKTREEVYCGSAQNSDCEHRPRTSTLPTSIKDPGRVSFGRFNPRVETRLSRKLLGNHFAEDAINLFQK